MCDNNWMLEDENQRLRNELDNLRYELERLRRENDMAHGTITDLEYQIRKIKEAGK